VTPSDKIAFSGFVLITYLRGAATPPGKIAFFGSVFIILFADLISTLPGKTDFDQRLNS
jgi:hypothetical protein